MAMPFASQAKQIAHFQEEAIARSLQPAKPQALRLGEPAAVPGKQYGAWRGLVREEAVDPKGIAFEAGCRPVRPGGRIADDYRQVRAGVVSQVVLAARIVLPHEPEKHRPRHLIFEFQERHRGATGLSPMHSAEQLVPLEL